MNGINLATTAGGSMYQNPGNPTPRHHQKTEKNTTPHSSPPTPIRPPEVLNTIDRNTATESLRDILSMLFIACGVMTIVRLLTALAPESLFVPSSQPSTHVKSGTPRHRPHSGFGLSHLGRLGMMLAFFGSATAESRNLRSVSDTKTAYPEWQSHHYEAETRHIDGSNNWFGIAHIADGNSTAARFNVNGHNGDNHWNIDIQLWAGMNAISSCWNAVHPDHIPQGFRFARNTEGRIFLEVQGPQVAATTSSDQQGLV